MPRGRIIVFGVVIALVSVGLTLAAIFLLLPVILGQTQMGQGNSNDRNSTGQGRETAFDPNDRIQILVALQNLPRGFEIPSNAYNNAVGIREFPAASVPRDAIVVENIDDAERIVQEEVVGKLVRTDMVVEQPLLRSNLVDNVSDLAQVGSDVAVQLEPGMRGMAIPVDMLSSVGYAVHAGDRVDVVLSFAVVDVDEDFQSQLPNEIFQVQLGTTTDDGGRNTAAVVPVDGASFGRIETIPPNELANIVPSEPQRPRLVTQRTVVCAPVLLVGEAPADGQIFTVDANGTPVAETSERPDVVVLGVTPQEVNVLQWAVQAKVTIGLSLCSVQEGAASQTSSVTLQYLFETYNVPVPPRLPYSLEPSLRDAPAPTRVAP
jgi:pilus assembly protein CpaB